jgi:peptide/nickel transport system substrate-binding protein
MFFHKIRFLGVCLLLVCAACSGAGSAGRELHYGLTLSPTGIDPHVNASNELGIPLSSVYDTLVFRDPEAGFVPGLSERWEISSDGMHYTFYLRHDVLFHDGTAFNATAVKVNLERILDPKTKSARAVYMLGPLKSVDVVDEYTVRLNLSDPYAPLLDSLSQVYLGMASPAALEKWGADYAFHQVGTGPFRFVEYIPDDHLTLERNPEYAWGPSIYRQSTAQVDRIVFRFYSDAATRAPALLSKDADIMGEVMPADAVNLQKDGRFTLYPVEISGQPLQFFFNVNMSPMDDPSVRRAILEATDRKTLVQTIFGSFSPVATGPLTAVTWGAKAVVPTDAYNSSEAETLLKDAGWVDTDGDGIREKDGEELKLRVVFPPWGLSPQVAEMLEMQWKAAGVAADLIQVSTFAALKDAQAAGNYHLISYNTSGTDPDLLRSFYRSGGAYNLCGVQSDRLDSLLDEAVRTGEDAQRLEAYHQAQDEIAAQYLLIPIRDYVNLNVAGNRVHGLHYSAQGWFPVLIDVTLE